MRILTLVAAALAAVYSSASLSAQNCPERAIGFSLGTGDDTVFAPQSIGFTFPFAGSTYTDVHVCCNGYVTLSNGGTPPPGVGDYTSTPAELASGPPRIAVLWNDLNITVGNGAGVYFDSTPSRCTITWDRAVNFGLTPLFQVQLQLFPSGEIKMLWSENASNNSTFNYLAGSGITGVSPGLVAPPAPSDFSAVVATASDIVFEQWSLQGTFDLPLKALTFTPTAPGWLVVPTPWTGCAATADYGTGCISVRDSFYEIMPAAQFDLANTTWSLLRQPNGYVATNGLPGTYVPPTGTAQLICNADDIVTTVTLAQAMPVPAGSTTQLVVSSNGNIALAGIGNGAGFVPDVLNFLAFVRTSIAPAFHDYNPAAAGSGKIWFEQAGGIAYVTWDGVFSYLTTNADRFQVQFELATGNVTIVYLAMATGSNDYLIGYSVGGPSPRPEETDVSTALAVAMSIADVAQRGLTLTTNGLPLLGNATFGFTVTDVPNVAPIGLLFFGDQVTPAIDLTFLGMPGCRGYTNANLTSVSFPVALPAGTGGVTLAIPSTVILIGVQLTAQAGAFSLATPLNLVVSNGTLVTLGV